MSRGALLLRAARDGRGAGLRAGRRAPFGAARGRRGRRRRRWRRRRHGRPGPFAPTGSGLTRPSVRAGRRSVALTNLGKIFWPEAGLHQARPAAVLRRRLARPAAASARPRDGDEALPQRHSRQVLLHEAHAVRRSRSGSRPVRSVHKSASRDRVSHGAGPRLAALGGEPRLHRPQPVVRALRRHRPAGLPAFRSRSRAGRAVRAGARDRARRARRAGGAGHDAAGEDQRLERACTSTCPIVRGPAAEGGLAVRQAAGQGAGAAASRS